MASEKGGVWGAVVAGAAGAAGAALFLWFSGLLSPLWSWVQSASGSLWAHLIAQSNWPNWLAYVISVLALFSFLRWALRSWRNRKDSTWRFNQLSVEGVMLRWVPTSGLPSTLQFFCLNCDTQLVYEVIAADHYEGRPQRTALHCERCRCERFQIDGNLNYLNARFIRQIDRLHRTGEWKKHVPD